MSVDLFLIFQWLNAWISWLVYDIQWINQCWKTSKNDWFADGMFLPKLHCGNTKGGLEGNSLLNQSHHIVYPYHNFENKLALFRNTWLCNLSVIFFLFWILLDHEADWPKEIHNFDLKHFLSCILLTNFVLCLSTQVNLHEFDMLNGFLKHQKTCPLWC